MFSESNSSNSNSNNNSHAGHMRKAFTEESILTKCEADKSNN